MAVSPIHAAKYRPDRNALGSGVFIANNAPAPAGQSCQQQQGQPALIAKFLPVQLGIRDGEHIEVTSGIEDGARVITTGAGALKDGDRIVAAGGQGRGREGRGERANREGGQRQGSDR